MLWKQGLVGGLRIQQVTSPWLVKVYAYAGADFVFIEGEHGSLDPTKLPDFFLTCQLCDLPRFAKCRYLERGLMKYLMKQNFFGNKPEAQMEIFNKCGIFESLAILHGLRET
jgi:hypothetical protein